MSEYRLPQGYTMKLVMMGSADPYNRHIATCEIGNFTNDDVEQAYPEVTVTVPGADGLDAMRRAYAIAMQMFIDRHISDSLFVDQYLAFNLVDEEAVNEYVAPGAYTWPQFQRDDS